MFHAFCISDKDLCWGLKIKSRYQIFQHVFNKLFSHLFGKLCLCEVHHIDERQDAEYLWGHLIIKAYIRIWALEILAWIRAVMYTCMWWDVRGGWWTKWTKSFFEGRLKIKIKINLCTHVSHCTYAKTQTTSVVYTQVHMLSRMVVDKVDKELCGGGRAHAREHLPWERRHIRSSSAFQAAWK